MEHLCVMQLQHSNQGLAEDEDTNVDSERGAFIPG